MVTRKGKMTGYRSIPSIELPRPLAQKLIWLGNYPFCANAIIHFSSFWTPLMRGNSRKSFMITSQRKL